MEKPVYKKFKALVWVILLVVSSAFFAAGKLSEPGWIDLVKWVTVVLVLGHTASDITATLKGKQ